MFYRVLCRCPFRGFFVVVVLLLLFSSACGRSGYAPSQTQKDEVQVGSAAGTRVECSGKQDVQLLPVENSLDPTRRATLSWSVGEQKCAFRRGTRVPAEMEGALQFAEIDGVVDVFSVVPWRLQVPEDVDATQELAPGEEHVVFLESGDERVTVRFSHQDGWVTLLGVIANDDSQDH